MSCVGAAVLLAATNQLRDCEVLPATGHQTVSKCYDLCKINIFHKKMMAFRKQFETYWH